MNHDTSSKHAFGCLCAMHSRRMFTGGVLGAGALLAVPAWAREGVEVGSRSNFSMIVSAEQIEQAAAQQYREMLQQATAKNALAGSNSPQLKRLRAIAQRLIPFTFEWNDRARAWRWEVNLINSAQINAFCMPGGKIAFYTGILDQLNLTDDEAAMVMGHEMAHALREHARARLAKTQATSMGLSLGAQLLGLGDLGNVAANLGTQLLSLKFSRSDETEADLVGLELAARGGFDPDASVSLWRKMGEATKNQGGLAFLSTHPSGPDRIRQLEANVPRVEGLYQAARRG